MASNLFSIYPDLKEKLQTSINGIHKTECALREIKPEEMGNQTKACTTLRIQLDWNNTIDERLPRKLILQMPSVGEEHSFEDDAKEWNIRDYNREVEFYAFFKLYSRIPIPLPCCYAAELEGDQHGILVLEDLSEQAVFIDDISTGMTTGQLLNVTAALSVLHSWCLKNSSAWQGKFNGSKLGSLQLRNTMEAGLEEMKSKFPERCARVDFDFIREKFREQNIDEWSDKIGGYIPEVLTRNELWTNSLLFRKRSDGTAGDDLVAIVNWRNVGKGSLLEDICSLLSWCTTSEVRRKYQRILLVYYRKKLEQGVSGDVELPDNDTLWRAYRETFWLKGLMLLGLIPALLNTSTSNELADAEEKKEIMLERAIACYEDSLAFLNEHDD